MQVIYIISNNLTIGQFVDNIRSFRTLQHRAMSANIAQAIESEVHFLVMNLWLLHIAADQKKQKKKEKSLNSIHHAW